MGVGRVGQGFQRGSAGCQGPGTVGAKPRVWELGCGAKKWVPTYWLLPPSHRPPARGLPGGPPAAGRSRPPWGCGGRNGLSTPATSEAARAPSWRKRAARVRKDSLYFLPWGSLRVYVRRVAPGLLEHNLMPSRNNPTEWVSVSPSCCLPAPLLTTLFLRKNIPSPSKGLFSPLLDCFLHRTN